MTDDLAYFRGWKAASDDIATFLEKLALDVPKELDIVAESYVVIAKAVREKGETALAMAESARNSQN